MADFFRPRRPPAAAVSVPSGALEAAALVCAGGAECSVDAASVDSHYTAPNPHGSGCVDRPDAIGTMCMYRAVSAAPSIAVRETACPPNRPCAFKSVPRASDGSRVEQTSIVDLTNSAEDASSTERPAALHPFFQRPKRTVSAVPACEEWSPAPLFPVSNTDGHVPRVHSTPPVHCVPAPGPVTFTAASRQREIEFTLRRPCATELCHAERRVLEHLKSRAPRRAGESSDEDFCVRVPQRRRTSPRCAPAVVLCGPPGAGKTALCGRIAAALRLPQHRVLLVDADAARAGRPFDDALGAVGVRSDAFCRTSGHGQPIGSHASFFGPSNAAIGEESPSGDDAIVSAGDDLGIRLAVVVDDADVCFPGDGLYGALSSFVRAAPPGVLVLLTSAVGAATLGGAIDFAEAPLEVRLRGAEGTGAADGPAREYPSADDASLWDALGTVRRDPLEELPASECPVLCVPTASSVGLPPRVDRSSAFVRLCTLVPAHEWQSIVLPYASAISAARASRRAHLRRAVSRPP